MAPILSDFSQAVADTVEASSLPVVRVEGRDRLPATGIVFSADGTIVTSNHTLERDDNIVIGLANGDTLKASLAGRDPSTDLAVLSTEEKDLPVADWETTKDLHVGHLVLALGRPGRNVRATMGIVSVLSPAGSGWRSPAGGMVDRYLQTDLVMYPGFSGGPLVGSSGRFLGLNTSALLHNVPWPYPARLFGRLPKRCWPTAGCAGVTWEWEFRQSVWPPKCRASWARNLDC